MARYSVGRVHIVKVQYNGKIWSGQMWQFQELLFTTGWKVPDMSALEGISQDQLDHLVEKSREEYKIRAANQPTARMTGGRLIDEDGDAIEKDYDDDGCSAEEAE
jgi:hypothetical protein